MLTNLPDKKKKSRGHYYYLHLTDEETEARKGKETSNQLLCLALKPVLLASVHVASLLDQPPEKSRLQNNQIKCFEVTYSVEVNMYNKLIL